MNRSGSVVTIGVFDGVHIGHRAIIKKAVKRSKDTGYRSVVLTFDPHPLKFLHSRRFAPSLISLKHRIAIIGKLGIDKVLVIKFNKSMANLSPEKFVSNILVKKLCAKEVVVGEDFRFGKDAESGVEDLKDIAKRYSIKVRVIRPVMRDSTIISSTVIRQLIFQGRIDEASRLLGRPFSILGTVVSGTKLARKLGYPTANINPHHEVMPPSGVYAVRVRFAGKAYGGVMNIGIRPTFYNHGRDREPSVEVHIFNFHKRVYGKDLEITFVCKLRDEKRFNKIDSLIEQIKKDEIAARTMLL